MQIPKAIRGIVTFVRTEAGGDAWVGTGFFVGEQVADRYVTYVVTCKHCVDPPEALAPVSSVAIRLNVRGGGSTEIESAPSDREG